MAALETDVNGLGAGAAGPGRQGERNRHAPRHHRLEYGPPFVEAFDQVITIESLHPPSCTAVLIGVCDRHRSADGAPAGPRCGGQFCITASSS